MVRNNAAATSMQSSTISGSLRLRYAPAPSARPASTGMPIIRNALKLYWSMPATRWSNAPASGVVTRYPR